ncbi:hypothetical protein GTY41_40165 [Streptomyces sp. SID685]|nr:hypothetical protein [Streptomyces sp. SID685]MYR90971.1 hypothetical protein [Streptomyces sp. SID685]
MPDGVNIGDGRYEPGGEPPQAVAEQTERIAAAREVADAEGGPLFGNARVDVSARCRGSGPHPGAGRRLPRADGVVVPGAVACEAVEKLVAGVDGPLNVMVSTGAPTVAELAAVRCRPDRRGRRPRACPSRRAGLPGQASRISSARWWSRSSWRCSSPTGTSSPVASRKRRISPARTWTTAVPSGAWNSSTIRS